MSAPETSSENSLSITRTIRAPREKVFRAWTDPDELVKWWDTPMFTCVAAEADLRPEGRYRTSFRVKESGAIVTVAGVFREVTPPERLVYSWRWEEWEAGAPDTLVTVEFHGRGDETDLVLVHERFPEESMRDHHAEGWEVTFDSLEKGLDSLEKGLA